MIELVKQLISNYQHEAAIKLLRSAGKAAHLCDIAEVAGHSDFFETKITKELHTLATELAQKQSTQATTAAEDHAEIKPIILLRNQLLKEQDFLRGQLRLIDTDQKRGEAAFRIIEIDRQLQRCWDTIDYFKEHGHLPPDDVEQAIMQCATWADLVKLRGNYTSNISRAKSGKVSSDKLPFYQAVLQRIDQLLNQPITR